MSKIDDGGPAFTITGEAYGMSLRDYFAGQALAGVTANRPLLDDINRFSQANGRDADEATASFCFDIADAMLAARAKGAA